MENSASFENIKIPYPSEGVIRTAALDDTVSPENSVQLAVNMNFDRVGAMQTRLGLEAYADLQQPIRAFGTYGNFASSTFQLLAQSGIGAVGIYAITAPNSLVLKRTLTAGIKARFAQFLNLTWMINGTAGDAVNTYNGSAFGTTMVPASFPKGDFIQAGFEGRVWIAQKLNDVIWYTDIVQFTPPSTYALTFDASLNFIKNFSPQNGETITGLFVTPRALLVFKQNHIYRVYGATSVDAYPAYNVGTYSQESIVQTKDGIYFHHSSGFYKFTYDGQPTEISRRVIDFVKAITRVEWDNVSGIWDGYDTIEWSVGTVTVEGVTFTNCVMRYTISTQVWTIYDYIANDISASIRYDNGTTILNMIGTEAGKVGILGSGFTDFGVAFYYEVIDRWRSYTDMYAKTKILSGLNVYSENAAGANLQYQSQKSPANVWNPLGTVTEENNALFPSAKTEEDFTVSRLRLVGTTKATPVVVHGFEILSVQDEGFEKN